MLYFRKISSYVHGLLLILLLSGFLILPHVSLNYSDLLYVCDAQCNNLKQSVQGVSVQAPIEVVLYGKSGETTAFYNTLESLLQQTFKDWHVTCSLINTSSSENAEEAQNIRITILDKLEQLTKISTKKLKEKITINVESEGSGPLYKLWASYSGDTVLIPLQAGDIFFHNSALEKIASVHGIPDKADCSINTPLVSYGRYSKTFSDKTAQVILGYKLNEAWPENKLRLQFYSKGLPGYPVAFKAKLFKSIMLIDLFYGDALYSTAVPEAYLFPLIELTRNDAAYIKEPLVIRSPEAIRSNRDKASLQQLLRNRPYRPRETLLNENSSQNSQVTLMAYSKDRPLQLYALLESLQEHLYGDYVITVIYSASDELYAKAYKEVEDAYPLVKFIAEHKTEQDFKSLTLNEIYLNEAAPYLLFAVDDLVLKSPVNLNTCIHHLEKTQAVGFHLRLGKNITYNYMRNKPAIQPPLYDVGQDVIMWKSNASTGGWHYPYSLDMTLYRKADIRTALEQLGYKTPNKLEQQWSNSVKRSLINLCFNESKTINVPLNVVQKDCPENRHMDLYTPNELLTIFNRKLKINIKNLYLLTPTAPHVSVIPEFIER